MFGHPAETRAVYLFHGEAELRWVRTPPRRGFRVRSSRGDAWIIADVLRSGARTYTVTCVAPREIDDIRARATAYLRRDWEFCLALPFMATGAVVALSIVTAIWFSFFLVATSAAFAIFAWATK